MTRSTWLNCSTAAHVPKLAGSGNLFIHLDTFHMAIEEADMAEAIRLATPSLGYLELGQSGRGPLGTGVVDIVEAVRVAIAAGYRGPIGVEAFSNSILTPVANEVLAIWRTPHTDGAALAREAIGLIHLDPRPGRAAAGYLTRCSTRRSVQPMTASSAS